MPKATKKKKQAKKEPEPQLPQPLEAWLTFDRWVKQREQQREVR